MHLSDALIALGQIRVVSSHYARSCDVPERESHGKAREILNNEIFKLRRSSGGGRHLLRPITVC